MKIYFFPLLVVAGLAVAVTAQASVVSGTLSTGLSSGPQVVVVTPPLAAPPAGPYSSSQNVQLSADGAQSIHFTTNGSTPTCSAGTPYSTAIAVSSSMTIQALSCYADNVSSSVASFAYVISTPPPQNNPAPSGGGGGGGGVFTPLNTTQPITPTSTLPAIPQILGASTSIAHVNGTLVLDGSTVYLLSAGQRHGFRDPQEFQSYGYKFSQTVPINDADKLLPAGDIMKAMTGTLVLDKSDNRTVYMVGKNYTKRGFVSYKVFQGLGFVKVSSTAAGPAHGMFKIDLTDYPAGTPIASASDPHPEGALVKANSGTVWWILDGKRSGFESETVFDTYGFTFDRVVPTNAADLALPEGPLVKLRDGTLVQQAGAVYIISDGQKLQFASTQVFTSSGYNTANVIQADISVYPAGPTFQ